MDKEAICVFVATGFFLDTDSYYKGQKVLRPGHNYQIDAATQQIIAQEPYFKWHYNPIERSLDTIVDEFADVFETIIKEQTESKSVILPLSGGLDSRTQAVALNNLKIPTKAYSYTFTNGHDETFYGRSIAKLCNFPFRAFKVPQGYLWNTIDRLAEINQCYSEFTHPRQMAFIESYTEMGEVFSLGHWGDVLFDDTGVDDNLDINDQVEVLYKKLIKKGGEALAIALWEEWDLEGDFKAYFKQRLHKLLTEVNIPENANAQIRAFKSLYWAPRWTSVNLSIFSSQRAITLPYYDRRMCDFICSVPEKYLSNRQIQIGYIKKRNPKLAQLMWQDHRPFNLYNYQNNKIPYNLPFRVLNKLKRMFSSNLYVQRNWELQFLGENNDNELRQRLFNNPEFLRLVPEKTVKEFYQRFKSEDKVFYSHPLSMLLTLSLFTNRKSITAS